MQVPRVTEPTLTRSALEESVEQESLRETNQRLQRQLVEAKRKTEKLVDAALQGARDAALIVGPVPPVPTPAKDSRSRGAEVALWHLTDWQGSKRTTSYDSDVMRRRVLTYCDVAARITEMHRADHPVRECMVAFGGDMVEGLFNFPTQPFEIDATIFGQFVTVSRLLVDVVRRALATYETVTVVPEWGNHGRIGSKRSAVPRADNIDRMCFEMARQLLEAEERLTWQECPEDIQRVEVGSYRAILIHGDEIGRNGYASPQTIVQWVTRQKSGAYPWSFRDAYVGHYHNHSEHALPDGEGAVYFSGSTESDNRYAGVTMAASAVPTQRLNFIDPDEGRVTEARKVWLA
jgi:hypothetical protein